MLFLFYLFISFHFNGIYMIEKDVFQCGPLIRVGSIEAWEKVGRTNASKMLHFLLYLLGVVDKGREPVRAAKLHQHQVIGDSHCMPSKRLQCGEECSRLLCEVLIVLRYC